MRLLPLFLALLAGTSSAQMVLKQPGTAALPMRPVALDAKITADRGLADVTLTYEFANPSSSRIEADFIYALPKNATATGFAYWYGDEKVVARIVEKERAAEIYKAITSRMRDPALVELVGKKTMRARIFPVMPNANLRIELRMVITMIDGQLALPLRAGKEPYERLKLSFETKETGAVVSNSLGLAVNEGKCSLDTKNYRPPEQFRVQVKPQGRVLGYGARSGGPDGFFCLLLPAGVKSFALSGLGSYSVFRDGRVVTGRYRSASGAVRLRTANGVEDIGLRFADEAHANNPASAVWAFEAITAAKSTKEAMALSSRFNMPSKFTSWLAIPVEERERYRREMASADIKRNALKLYRLAEKGRGKSSEAVQIQKEIGASAKILGEKASDVIEEALSEEIYGVADDLLTAKYMGEPTARYERKWKVLTELVANLKLSDYDGVSYSVATKIVERFEKGQPNAAPAMANFLKVSAREGISGMQTMQDHASWRAYELARRSFEATRAGKSNEIYERGLQRLTKAGLLRDSKFRSEARKQVLNQEMYDAARQLGQEIIARRYDSEKVRSAQRKVRALVKESQSPDWNAVQALPWELKEKFSHWARLVSEGKVSTEPAVAMKKEIDLISKVAGDDGQSYLRESLHSEAISRASEVRWHRYTLIRDRAALGKAEAALKEICREAGLDPEEQIRSLGKQWGESARDGYIDALRAGDPSQARQARQKFIDSPEHSYHGKNWIYDRAERIKVGVELDSLQSSQLTPAEAARKEVLTRKLEELRSRMGDPLISLSAPADTLLMIARMPDGEVKALRYVPETLRWEMNFDIPASASEGRYEVLIMGLGASGAIRCYSYTYSVDLSAPKLEVTANVSGGILKVEVRCSYDTSRAELFFTPSKRVSLRKIADGWFEIALPAVDTKSVTVVIYDRAHNRVQREVEVQG